LAINRVEYVKFRWNLWFFSVEMSSTKVLERVIVHFCLDLSKMEKWWLLKI